MCRLHYVYAFKARHELYMACYVVTLALNSWGVGKFHFFVTCCLSFLCLLSLVTHPCYCIIPGVYVARLGEPEGLRGSMNRCLYTRSS